jgi:outer membrane protein OmpA-like peptidoglycan-associated protein
MVAVWVSSACATKGFVTETVERRTAVVEQRVAAVERNLDDTADRTQRNTAHIGEVDKTANMAVDKAVLADESAQTAQATAFGAARRAGALEATNRQLLFEVVLSEDHGQFRFADAALPETAVSDLDALVDRARNHQAAVHFEIEGHTDATGPEPYNRRLGLERAESVKRYLYENHQLPLHKINVFSFGEERPIAPNDSVDGRAKNRRVVVRVLGAPEPDPGAAADTAGDQQ